MKIAVGITGPHNSITRDAIKTLLNELKLLHINLRQPIVDFCASCLNVDPHELDNHTPLHTHYHELKMNLHEMQHTIETFLCLENKNHLMDTAAARINKTTKILGGHQPNYIISNITNEREAAWVRSNGGVIVHVRPLGLFNKEELIEQSGDEVINPSRNTPANAENLRELVQRIASHHNIITAAKAA